MEPVTIRRLLVAMAALLLSPAVVGAGADVNAVVAVPPVDAPAQVGNLQAVRLWSTCVDRLNGVRAAAGRSPLGIDLRMATAANAQSRYQAQQQKMSHVGSNGSNAGLRLTAAGYPWSVWGENVAAGQADCDTVLDAWLGSAPHRANILNTTFDSIGIGMALGANGVPYWTMDLAAGV